MQKYLAILRRNARLMSLASVPLIFLLLAVYAPFFAASEPLLLKSSDKLSFPLLSSLLSKSIYCRPIDLFFNALIFTLPLFVFVLKKVRKKRVALLLVLMLQLLLSTVSIKSTLFLKERTNPLNETSFVIKPIIPVHWQDNALIRGEKVELRPNGQSLYATLLFGLRTSFSLAVLTVALTFTAGVILGLCAGYFGGLFDLIFCRVLEVFESLPSLLVLLVLVSITECTHLLFVSCALSSLSWPAVARVIRLEIRKQMSLPHVETLRNLHEPLFRILKVHLLPSTYWMILTLLPQALFSVMVCESALSFLGLSDPLSASIGVLIDEARRAYPLDPNLFWPPAAVLMLLLIALTGLGDEIRRALDPKLREYTFKNIESDNREESARWNRNHPSADNIL